MSKEKIPEFRAALREAVDEAGSLSALGRLVGCKHNTFTVALKRGQSISAEMAVKVSAVSGIPLNRFRPDMWGPNGEVWGPNGEDLRAHRKKKTPPKRG